MVVPVLVGFTLGPWSLAAYLIGVKTSSAALSTAMFNAGGTFWTFDKMSGTAAK
jgi:Na+/H+-translocating membrane pyrophosphatase